MNDKSSQGTEPARMLIVNIGRYYFGAPIEGIHDVIRRQKTTSVPLTNDNIVGLMNLRGHIVTEVDMSRTLDVMLDDKASAGISGYSIVVSKKAELYSLVFDGIGDVVDIDEAAIERLPDTVNPSWRSLCRGVCRMPEKLLTILDLDAIIASLSAPEQRAL